MSEKNIAKTYDPKQVEDRLYAEWMEKGYFHAEIDKEKTPFTIVIHRQTLQVSFIWDMLWMKLFRISL